MLTLIKAATLLGLSPSTLRVQLHKGKLRGRKVGRDWTVSEREVERYRTESRGRVGRYRGRDGTTYPVVEPSASGCEPCRAGRHADCETAAGDCTNTCHPRHAAASMAARS